MGRNPLIFLTAQSRVEKKRGLAEGGGRGKGARAAASAGRPGAWCAFALLLIASPASAQETVRGVPITTQTGDFLVINDVNVRAGNSTRSEKIGKLKDGDKVTALGVTRDGWIAIRLDGDEVGFVFGNYLLALIDGTLDGELKGEAVGAGGAKCGYVVRHLGKTPIPDVRIVTSDYEIEWRCATRAGQLGFLAFMFITEAPYALSRSRIYQIGLDVREIGEKLDEPLSTIVMYERAKDRVVLDSVSLSEFRASSPEKERPAKTVPEALVGAIMLALGAWNEAVWDAIAAGQR